MRTFSWTTQVRRPWAYPLDQPREYNSSFGPRDPISIGGTFSGDFHYGVDLRAALYRRVYPVWDGTVSHVGRDDQGLGSSVVIDHGGGLATLYAHLDLDPVLAVGHYVTQLTLIGNDGAAGLSTGPHLHFGLLFNGTFWDPWPMLLLAEER